LIGSFNWGIGSEYRFNWSAIAISFGINRKLSPELIGGLLHPIQLQVHYSQVMVSISILRVDSDGLVHLSHSLLSLAEIE
jgi:hypothetical protein